jgi:hypothetical protein
VSLASTASHLLTKYGEAVRFTYNVGEESDPATGAVLTAGTPTNVDGYGYPGRYSANEVDGTNILAGDIRLVVEKVSTRPQVGWRVTVDSKTYRVQNVTPLRKTAADIAYICQLRAQ